MECTKKVKVVHGAVELELVPKKVWAMPIPRKQGETIKIGLFHDPTTGKYFRAKVPQDYPECA